MSGPITRFGLDAESREERQEKILGGVIASVYRQVPQSVLGTFVGSIALVAVFWNAQDRNVLFGWFALVVIEAMARLLLARAFGRAADAQQNVHLWAQRWVAMATAAGAVWGAAGVLFFTPNATDQLILVSVILGVSFGSLTLYATHRPALYFYLPLAFLPLVARMVAEQDPAYYTTALVMLAVFGFTLIFGRNFGEAIFESVKNNYENEVLVVQLMNEKRVADEARRSAENATRSKTQFFAAASHDLRQPLQAIGIYVSLMKKRAQGPLEPLVANLSSAVESLSKLVEELLEISRLDSGAIQPRTQNVAVDDLLHSLEQEFMPQAAGKGLELRVRRSGMSVESDPMLLMRVLRNLVANAIRYTTKGGVMIGARRRGGVISIEVYDTGPGIKQQELDRVFEEFYRGESGKSEGGGGGFGLGLSIVRRICSVLGHPLVVTTRPGSGTVFRVECQPAPQAAPRRRRGQEPAETELVALDGLTVVLLEDNQEILNSLTRLLRSWGADILSSTSFNASLVKKLGLRARVDLVVADQNLGNSNISGVEASLRIRELLGVPVPVIMLTAVHGADVIAEFQRLLRQRIERKPESAATIARSRNEEPVVLQKPTNAAGLNATIAKVLRLVPDTEGLAGSEPATLGGQVSQS